MSKVILSGHFEFTPLEKNAGTLARDIGTNFFLKGSKKSNQSSKHLSKQLSGHES